MFFFKQIQNWFDRASTIAQIMQWIFSIPVISTFLVTAVTVIHGVITHVPISNIIFLATGVLCFLTVFWERLDEIWKRNTIKYKLIYENCGAIISPNNDPEKFNMQVFINFANHSNKKIYYNIDSISVVINHRTVTAPNLRNTGTYLIPFQKDSYAYDTIQGLEKIDHFTGIITYVCTYGYKESTRLHTIKQKIQLNFDRIQSSPELTYQIRPIILEYMTN